MGDDFNEKVATLNPVLKKVFSYIDTSFPKGLSREEIAVHLDISPAFLSRLFRDECGLQLKDFINRCGMSRQGGR